VTGLQDKVDELRGRAVEVVTEPHQIFVHDDDSLGPAGHEEWQAFVRDSEGNVVGLVELVAPSP
jgi:methylmalonyl-CoA/ethylmalonyl-CoA epimerase